VESIAKGLDYGASHRQNRPEMPKDWCPFCPNSGRVPKDYDVYKS